MHYIFDKIPQMKSKIKFLHLLIICLLSSTLYADEALIANLNDQNGLAGETVFKIFKDSSNLMWIGTSNGLNRFNGVSSKTYNVSSKKQFNAILDIAQTSDGELFVCGRNGVFRLNIEADRLENISPQIKGNVSALATDGNTLYIGSDKGLFISREGRIEQIVVSRDQMSERNIIRDIFVDSHHRVWLVSNQDLFAFDARTKRLIPYNIGNSLHFVGNLNTLTVVGGKAFVGSDNEGIFTIDLSTRRAGRYINVGGDVIMELSSDGHYLYVATDGGGAHIVSLKDNLISQSFDVNSNPKLSDNSVYCFFHDTNTGVNWFGYFRQGLTYTYYNRPLFHTYSFGNFTSVGINVRSFCINGAQKIIGTRNGLYFIDEQRNIVKYYSPKELGGSIVTSICLYASAYYVATYDGSVSMLNPSNMQISRFSTMPELLKASVSKLLVSPSGELWMASNRGIFVYNVKTKKMVNYNQENSRLYEGYANNLMFDRQGRCWISTQKGLCLYSPQDRMIRSSGFPSDFFNTEAELNCTLGAGESVVCFSFNGLFKTNEEMTHYGPIQLNKNIYDNYISFVQFDKTGHYWVGTEHGLFRFDSDFNSFQHYDNDDNLHSPQFSMQACYIDSGNNLWMGSTAGLVYAHIPMIDKESSKNFDIIPDIVYVDGKSVDGNSYLNLIRKHQISISWNLSSEELNFVPVLLNYGNPNGHYFEYRFNSQKNWLVITNKEMVNCSNLHIGTNKLYIRQVGSNHIVEYQITVVPSAWAIIEMLVLIVLCIILWKTDTIRYVWFRLKKYKKGQTVDSEEAIVDLEGEKYKRIKIDENEFKKLSDLLVCYIEKEKPYLDPNLKMSDLAQSINCTSIKLSQLLNQYEKQNYYDFINKYRLEEFKRRVTDPAYSRYTITALSEQCGFKKSTFFTTFKKIEGITPNEYLRKIGVDSTRL